MNEVIELKPRRRIQFMIVVAECTATDKDCKNWLGELCSDMSRDLGPGEIIESIKWEVLESGTQPVLPGGAAA